MLSLDERCFWATKGSNRLFPFYFNSLPPLSEQKLIVAEIEKQLAKTKQLKEHIIANQQATEQLLKALLHHFWGGGKGELNLLIPIKVRQDGIQIFD